MPRRNVGNLMRHHPGQFRLGLRLEDQAGVDKEESARQGEGIDLFGIQDLDGERHFGIGVPHQILADSADILRDDGVVYDLCLPLYLLRHLFAKGNLFLERVEVDPLVYIPISDRVGIL